MLDNCEIDKKQYSLLMDTIKKMNEEYIETTDNKYYIIGRGLNLLSYAIKNKKTKSMRKAVSIIKNSTKTKTKTNNSEKYTPNYFSNERIAIYTCIIGNYDEVFEPYFVPDNCDFYIFTDLSVKDDSIWEKINIKTLNKSLQNLPPNVLNRYIKLHPHHFFKDYKYSIYIDGNIQVISDLTEYIQSIKEHGIAAHLHSERKCAYDECRSVLEMRKDSVSNIEKHKNHLKNGNLPVNYGLIECNVLVREHFNKTCVKLMDEWWSEFLNYSKRDQISLPFVLFKNKIRPEEIGTLGFNVYTNPSFRIRKHNY